MIFIFFMFSYKSPPSMAWREGGEGGDVGVGVGVRDDFRSKLCLLDSFFWYVYLCICVPEPFIRYNCKLSGQINPKIVQSPVPMLFVAFRVFCRRFVFTRFVRLRLETRIERFGTRI